MTVRINSDEKEANMVIDGDIYEEHAQCLRGMAFSYFRRGIKNLNIQMHSTYYISTKGQQCLCRMRERLSCRGVQVFFKPGIE